MKPIILKNVREWIADFVWFLLAWTRGLRACVWIWLGARERRIADGPTSRVLAEDAMTSCLSGGEARPGPGPEIA